MIGSEDEFEAGAAGVPDVIEPSEPVGEVLPPPGPPEQTGELPLESFITKDLVGLLFAMPGYIIARRTGHDHWLPSESEKKLLGEAAHPAIVYLVRKYLGEAGPLAAIGAGLAAVYAPKFFQEQALQAQESQKPQPSGSPKVRPISTAESASSPASPAAESQPNSSDYRSPFSES